ncbi:hypothetical protein [Fibrella aquatica]|jgi:hypothetical protein|uniref:hypothetical protein n=1 Tax=Fibrella aquatica TaxID=3242487 RepID=UPI0035220673
METQIKPMTGKEKLRRLLEVKEQVQREVLERYKNDPAYRAMFDRLGELNTTKSGGK